MKPTKKSKKPNKLIKTSVADQNAILRQRVRELETQLKSLQQKYDDLLDDYNMQREYS